MFVCLCLFVCCMYTETMRDPQLYICCCYFVHESISWTLLFNTCTRNSQRHGIINRTNPFNSTGTHYIMLHSIVRGTSKWRMSLVRIIQCCMHIPEINSQHPVYHYQILQRPSKGSTALTNSLTIIYRRACLFVAYTIQNACIHPISTLGVY